MLLSFPYLAFAAVLRLLAAGRRDPFAREVELLALRHRTRGAPPPAVHGRGCGRPIVPFSLRSRGCCRLIVAGD